MLDYSEVYIYSDLPTSCPKCGYGTKIVLDLSHTKHQTQIHKCNRVSCKYKFIMQYDEDFDNGNLL